jgi:hypothetical protein
MARVWAIRDHVIPDRPPIQVTAGERVQAGQRDTTWPAFTFVTTADGSGWVPTRYVRQGTDGGIIVHPYDTTELETSAGEELTVVATDDVSGWTWVRNTAGREGWVPNETIEPMPARAVRRAGRLSR